MMLRAPYFKKDQLSYAKYEANAADYALFRGYDLVRSGSRYTMRDHDSMVFLSDGRWFWNSRGLKGRVIEFSMCYEGKTLPEAVLSINEMRGRQPAGNVSHGPTYNKEPKAFELPPSADSCKRLFAYLCATRQLDREIVADLIRCGDLYESCCPFRKKDGSSGEAHNAVFIGRDKNGVPRSAFQRGLISSPNASAFKADVAGSDPAAPFYIRGDDGVDTVVVFEASIDAISHATIYKLAGLNYKMCDRIATGGTGKTAALLSYLDEHPNISTVLLAFDEDTAGQAAADRTLELLEDRRLRIERLHQSAGKDWNDYLRFWRSMLDGGVCKRSDGARGGIYRFDSGGTSPALTLYDDDKEYKRTVMRCLLDGTKIVATHI